MRIKCIVTYDGTHFYGWQIQPDKRTVQEEIQKAIYKITHEEVTHQEEQMQVSMQ